MHFGAHSDQGRRPYNEDQYSVRTFQGQRGSDVHFFGLFDGHAGGNCSKYIAGIIPQLLSEDEEFEKDMSKAIKSAFYKANEKFLAIADKMKLNDGSTGLCCILKKGKLYVGNVGDCRALLVSNGKAIQMSNDQKPTDPVERARIVALGGSVVDCRGTFRVNSCLAVSRAFGNRRLKSVIRPDAEITSRELIQADAYLVMASDGLWDVLQNKDVCHICTSISGGPQSIAEELVNRALSRGSMDNVTCIVVRVGDYLAQMSLDERTSSAPIEKSKNEHVPMASLLSPFIRSSTKKQSQNLFISKRNDDELAIVGDSSRNENSAPPGQLMNRISIQSKQRPQSHSEAFRESISLYRQQASAASKNFGKYMGLLPGSIGPAFGVKRPVSVGCRENNNRWDGLNSSLNNINTPGGNEGKTIGAKLYFKSKSINGNQMHTGHTGVGEQPSPKASAGGDSLPWGGSVSLGNLNLNVAMQKNNGSNGDGSGTPSSRGLSDSQQSVGQRAGRNVDGSWNIGFRGTEDMRESRERTQPEVELKPCITKNKFQRTKDVILLTESARKKISFVDP